MSVQILFDNPNATELLCRATQVSPSPDHHSIVRILDDQMVGGVLYAAFTRESLCMHAASVTARWGCREMLAVCFDFPFHQLGCKRVFAEAKETNAHAREFAAALGFKEICIVPGVYRYGVGKVLLRMEKHECKWLKLKPRYYESNRQAYAA